MNFQMLEQFLSLLEDLAMRHEFQQAHFEEFSKLERRVTSACQANDQQEQIALAVFSALGDFCSNYAHQFRKAVQVKQANPSRE